MRARGLFPLGTGRLSRIPPAGGGGPPPPPPTRAGGGERPGRGGWGGRTGGGRGGRRGVGWGWCGRSRRRGADGPVVILPVRGLRIRPAVTVAVAGVPGAGLAIRVGRQWSVAAGRVGGRRRRAVGAGRLLIRRFVERKGCAGPGGSLAVRALVDGVLVPGWRVFAHCASPAAVALRGRLAGSVDVRRRPGAVPHGAGFARRRRR